MNFNLDQCISFIGRVITVWFLTWVFDQIIGAVAPIYGPTIRTIAYIGLAVGILLYLKFIGNNEAAAIWKWGLIFALFLGGDKIHREWFPEHWQATHNLYEAASLTTADALRPNGNLEAGKEANLSIDGQIDDDFQIVKQALGTTERTLTAARRGLAAISQADTTRYNPALRRKNTAEANYQKALQGMQEHNKWAAKLRVENPLYPTPTIAEKTRGSSIPGVLYTLGVLALIIGLISLKAKVGNGGGLIATSGTLIVLGFLAGIILPNPEKPIGELREDATNGEVVGEFLAKSTYGFAKGFQSGLNKELDSIDAKHGQPGSASKSPLFAINFAGQNPASTSLPHRRNQTTSKFAILTLNTKGEAVIPRNIVASNEIETDISGLTIAYKLNGKKYKWNTQSQAKHKQGYGDVILIGNPGDTVQVRGK